MLVASEGATHLPRHPARWALLGAIGAIGCLLLVTLVAIVSMGPRQFKASVATWLDDHHVWGERTRLLHAAQRLESADPEDDAVRAIAAGDVRLIPAAGIGGFFPGLPHDAYADHSGKFGARHPIYAGCVTSSAEDSRFRTAAFEYAAKYNLAIIARVKR